LSGRPAACHSIRGSCAWIVDDTGIPKDGKHSPGVKRQYSGTLGKIGNCQITVSLHAVGERGSLPLGFALYLPQEWCDDPERRQKAKIPDEVGFQTKPQLARALALRAAGWEIEPGPILADRAYGDDSDFRGALDAEGLAYLVAVSPTIGVFDPETSFAVPERKGGRGRTPLSPVPTGNPSRCARLPCAWPRMPGSSFPAAPHRQGR